MEMSSGMAERQDEERKKDGEASARQMVEQENGGQQRQAGKSPPDGQEQAILLNPGLYQEHGRMARYEWAIGEMDNVQPWRLLLFFFLLSFLFCLCRRRCSGCYP